MNNYSEKETTIRDVLKIVYKHKIIIITTMIIVMLTVFLQLELKVPKATASVKIMLMGQKVMGADHYSELRTTYVSLLMHEADAMTSSRVLERVVRVLELDKVPLDYEKQNATRIRKIFIDRSVEKVKEQLEAMTPEERKAYFFHKAVNNLKSNVSVTPVQNSLILLLGVSDYRGDVAAKIANSISRSYLIYDLERQIEELYLRYGEKHSLIKQLNGYIKEIEKTLDGEPIPPLEALGPASAKIVAQAYPFSTMMPSINKTRPLIGAFFVSLILGVLFAVAFEYMDYTVRSPLDVEKYLNIPYLGSILKRKSDDKLLINDANPSATDYTRSLEDFMGNLHQLMKDNQYKSFLLTDAEGSAEDAYVIANLGIYLSHKVKHNVLVIDANLRAPALSEIFNIADRKGFTDILKGEISLEEAVCNLDSGLNILPKGESNTNLVTILNSPNLPKLIEKAKSHYDFVLITCADIKNYSDAVIISSFMDCASILINEGKIRRQVIKNALTALEKENINMIGAILNNRTYVLPKIIYKLT